MTSRKGLFINSKPALCSIYESGVMAYKALVASEKFELDYADTLVPLDGYDFIVVNWHHAVNFQVDQLYLAPLKGRTFCIVTEMREDNALPLTPDIFDHYLVLDPTMKETGKFHAFPRPIEIVEALPSPLHETLNKPVIGSFGFATRGKRWDLIVEEVQKDFDVALIRFNIPRNDYPDASVKLGQVVKDCHSKIWKPSIELQITHEDMGKEDLIKWCAENTINVFFYYRNLAGLAAVTDQAVSAKRPILCSDDPTFRHVNVVCDPYPDIGIKAAITANRVEVDLLYNNWHPNRFLDKFEKLLHETC